MEGLESGLARALGGLKRFLSGLRKKRFKAAEQSIGCIRLPTHSFRRSRMAAQEDPEPLKSARFSYLIRLLSL